MAADAGPLLRIASIIFPIFAVVVGWGCVHYRRTHGGIDMAFANELNMGLPLVVLSFGEDALPATSTVPTFYSRIGDGAMNAESKGREAPCRTALSLYERGLTHGSTGNLSIRFDDGWLMSPTGASLGELDPASLSRLDAEGSHVSGDKPTKESFLHLAMYQQRPGSGAVVHLHSTN